jgi:2-oxoglutarate dehydrogenase E2 component (dihydrolipoamide succinyltransferase)
MSIDIKVPTLGESVTTATVARWLKHAGDSVAADEPLVELETDKVTVEVNAPAAGTLGPVAAAEGAEVEVGALLGSIESGAGAAKSPPPPQQIVAPPAAPGPVGRPADPVHAPFPAAAKLMQERHLSAAQLGAGSGKDARITKGDVLAFTAAPAKPAQPAAPKPERALQEGEERVKMTRLRRTIAARLKDAQNTAAMLTTFNEVDMSACMALRSEYKEAFEKKHSGVRLGFMGFFVRACVLALQEFPAVNAEVDGDDIVYKHFVHMGIAVGGPNGLVVPVIRHAERLSLAQIEKAVSGYGKAARDGTMKIDDLAGGTFSITNGGVYGSLMSTPILNPPQSAILGMHKIQDRPVAIAGKVEIRPMMYLALSYDHRIVDGKEAVSFLVRVKESIEDPRRLVLGI